MQKRTFLAVITALLGSAAPITAVAAPSPSCAQLATNAAYNLAGNAVITQTASDNQGLVSPSASVVPATASTAAYCLVHLQYSAETGPAFGYASGESQTVGINIGLPLNNTDGGTPTNPTGYTWTAINGAWNGKVENQGGSGLNGSLLSVTQSTNAGYVGSNTDGGHNKAQNGTDGTFTVIQATHQLDVGKTIDMASESQHQQYKWALALAQSYYGQAAARNYWYGCSTGGRQGLELAGDYGQDFDGLFVGSPVVFWNHYDLGKSWETLVNRDLVVGAGDSAITLNQFNNAVSHAIAACDVEGLDTVKDGVVDDFRQCMYTAEGDKTILSAPAGTCSGANCVDALQAQAIDLVWDDGALNGAPLNHAGKRLWWGIPPTILNPNTGIGPATLTGQLSPEMVYDWDHRDLTGNVNNMYSSRALAQKNPLGEPSPTSIEDEIQLDQSPLPVSATTNGATVPLGSYYDNDNYQGIINNVYDGPKHGKIIMYSGENDHVWMEAVIGYYRTVATLLGGGTTDYAGLSKWFRYYHVPAIDHCGGDPADNPGADPRLAVAPDGNIQGFDDLVNWVENGVVPQSAGDYTHEGILAVSPAGGVGSRPICPWPTTAIYNGSGSTAVASNFHCGGNLDSVTPTSDTNNVATACKEPLLLFGQATSNLLNWQQLGINPAQCPLPFQVNTHDFAGLGTSDVLWRDNSGNVGLWEVNGSKIVQSAVLGNVPTTWSVVGQRDFAGTGNSAVLWRDTAGNVGMWLMNGTQIASTTVLGNVPTSWSIVGTGDFNNNGYGDILWRDNSGNLAIWLMNGTTVSQVLNVGNVPVAWSVAGTDSRGDIVWRNTTTGEVGMWVMNGGTVAQSVDFGTVPLSWTIAGIGDFDGNGSADILWRDTSGNVGVWLMNGTQIMSTAALGTVPLNWTIAETGDFGGTGKTGILWTDNAGNVGVWFMKGTTVSSSTVYGNVGTAWNVQGLNAD